jgi:hypothetical protein
MSADPDRALLATSLAFAGAAVLGSAVAIREDLPGQPCGISVPLPVSAGLLVGWGAGVAAPWPMPAAAVTAAAWSQRAQPRALTGAVCAGIGIGCVLGTAIEPVTRRPRSWSPTTRLAIAVNIATSAALTVTGLRHRAAAKALRLRNQANQQRPDSVIHDRHGHLRTIGRSHRQYPHLEAAVRSWLGLRLEFAEGLGGLGEGVGDGLVPVHARAASAQFPRALLAQGCRDNRT